MKSDHIFITINGEAIVPYGNLKTLTQTIGAGDKYQTIRRAISGKGKAFIGEFEIRKLEIVRGTKNG